MYVCMYVQIVAVARQSYSSEGGIVFQPRSAGRCKHPVRASLPTYLCYWIRRVDLAMQYASAPSMQSSSYHRPT